MTYLQTLLTYTRSFFSVLVLCLASHALMAQTADLRLSTQLNCATGEYMATMQIRASDANSFSIGTSSVFVTYNPSSLTFIGYQSITFNENTLCGGQALWDTHSFDGSIPGLFNLTMALNSSSISCPLISNTGWVSIGTITFKVLNPDGNPVLGFDPTFSSFNAVPANNGIIQIQAGQYTGVNQVGVLRCAPVCSLSLTTPSLPDGQVGTLYSQTLTTSGSSSSLTYAVSAGSLPAGLSLNPSTGDISGTPTSVTTASFSVVVSDSQSCSATGGFTITTLAPPVCSLTATASPGTCNPTTNQYSVTGTISATNTSGSQSLTLSVGNVNTVVTMSGNGPVSYTLAGLTSDGVGKTISVLSSATACGSTSVSYTAPNSCIVGTPTYTLAQTSNPSQVAKGGVVTYIISLTNTGNATGSNVVISDQLSSTAVSFVGSATTSTGTFTPGAASGNWTIGSLAAGQTATLMFRVQLNQEGVTYNTVTAPNNQLATVCTTVPFRVCTSAPFQRTLAVAAGQPSYQWSLNGQPIAGATTNTLSVTALGTYTVATTGTSSCSDGSCCPFIFEAYGPAPSLMAVAVAATCNNATPLSNARIMLTGSSNAVDYNITMGSSFTAATPLFASNQSVSAVAGGVLLANQPNPATVSGQVYTIRAFTADGCYADSQVTIPTTYCNCPPPACLQITATRQR